MTHDYDFIIIGSGFGGSVSALRLSEKGYRVLVIEKGKWFQPSDFPETNWNVKRWFWAPFLRFFGFFKLTFMRHITILSGTGVGGGSLVYANALPVPSREFFLAPTWAHLGDWESELKEHYQIALKMLGAAPNPRLEIGDRILQDLARQIKRENEFQPTNAAVFFGSQDQEVPDPYFNGLGPRRSGCNFCGGCMVGCRFNAKNSLDKNYLYLAMKQGAEIKAESEVYDVTPLQNSDGSLGYSIAYRSSTKIFKKRTRVTAKGIIFSGGVLGTLPLLLKLKRSSLPNLSPQLGSGIRTNSESLIGITVTAADISFSDGIAIGSILSTDQYSSLEPVRYPSGSGFWRIFMSPLVHDPNALIRILKIIRDYIKHPVTNLRTYFVRDWAKQTQILLFMQTINGTLKFKSGFWGMKSVMEKGQSPTAFIPEARDLAERYSKLADGKATVLLTETLLGRPTTAHILGGANMGLGPEEGVIDSNNRVFGYRNMYVCDGSMISANPGVNPSLTITALTERAMSKIPGKTTKPN